MQESPLFRPGLFPKCPGWAHSDLSRHDHEEKHQTMMQNLRKIFPEYKPTVEEWKGRKMPDQIKKALGIA